MASDRGPRNLRQDATETAAAMFAEAGYDGISMREIAQALGVSKAALYYHFADKQSLMLAVLEEYLAEIERVLDETLPTQGGCREQIVALVRAIFSLPPGQRAVMRLASQEIGKLAPAARAHFDGLYHRRFIGRIERIIDTGVGTGELRPLDVPTATWILLGMMYPFFYGSGESSGRNVQSQVEQITAIFLDGAAAGDSSPRQERMSDQT